MMKLFAVAVVCAGLGVVAAEPPKCKMTGKSYPPDFKALPDGTKKNVSSYSKFCTG